MKLLIGLILVIVGILVGLYVGVWVCLVGGIVALVEAFKATPVVAMDVAISIVRILCAGFVGTISGFICIIPGVAMIRTSK